MRVYKITFTCGALAASFANFLLAMGAFAPWTLALFGPEPAAALWPQWLGALVLGFGLAWTTLKIRAVSLKLAVAAIALLEAAVLSWLFSLRGIAWPPFATLAAGCFGTLFGLLYCFSLPGRRARLIDEYLGASVSPATLERVLQSRLPFPFHGAEREATAIVCHCFNRREMAEALSSPDFVALSNLFCATAAQALKEAGGVVIAADGEHVHAVFGALVGGRDHALRACHALLDLASKIEAFRAEAEEYWGVLPDVRAAAATGSVIAGIFGLPGNGRFGAVGEAVEAARRLALANSFYGTRRLIGLRTFLETRGGVEVRPADLIWNHNIREEIYEPLGARGELPPEALARRDAFWTGVIHARAGRGDEARALLEPLLLDEAGRQDPLVRAALDSVAAPQ